MGDVQGKLFNIAKSAEKARKIEQTTTNMDSCERKTIRRKGNRFKAKKIFYKAKINKWGHPEKIKYFMELYFLTSN